MNAKNIITEQKTISAEQWLEIEKMASICRIKNQIADLLESAPEFSLAELIEFIQSLTEREIRKRENNAKKP
jgi:hypothetical protein